GGTAAPRARGGRRLLGREGPSASGGPTRWSLRAAAPTASEAGILRPKRLVMPNLMATPFFSDRVCGSIASCILEPDTNSHMSGWSLLMSRRFFMLFSLAEGPLLVHRANLIAQTHSTQCNQVLSAKPVDGENQL